MNCTFCIETRNLENGLREIIELASRGIFRILDIASDHGSTADRQITLAVESTLPEQDIRHCLACLGTIKNSMPVTFPQALNMDGDIYHPRTTMAYEF